MRVRYLYLATGAGVRWEPAREHVTNAPDQLVRSTSEMRRSELRRVAREHCANCPLAHVCPDAGRVELSHLEVEDGILFWGCCGARRDPLDGMPEAFCTRCLSSI